ncbi:hypothetical protein MVEN_02283000 [Mycena venus]|uniref:Uncharacterized protein n=1 Tax=Mycena venus TaxID=2733690 RepID=A0A8H6X4W7_9AGAR|nr:hypothetical protein MVEN_02283000 [Mycena venus]
MPSLQYSSASAPSFSLSSSGIIALVLLLMLAFGGWGCISLWCRLQRGDGLVCAMRRCVLFYFISVFFHISASEFDYGSYRVPCREAKRAAPASVLARARARIPLRLKRSVVVPSLKRLPRRCPYSLRHFAYPHPPRAVSSPRCCSGPRAPSKDDAVAYLVKARIRLGVTSKAAVLGKSPFGALCRSITPIAVNEVPASFATIRTRVSHGPSPLRVVFTASEPEPEPAPISATTASDIEEHSIAHALASLLASVYHAEDDDAVRFALLENSDAASGSDDPFEFDLGRAVPTPAPVDVAVTTPPLDIPTTIVESPSLTIGDGPKPTSRKRSNSFIGWRQGLSSKGTAHSGTKGSSSRQEKENDRFLRVPSPSRSSRLRPRRPRI